MLQHPGEDLVGPLKPVGCIIHVLHPGARLSNRSNRMSNEAKERTWRVGIGFALSSFGERTDRCASSCDNELRTTSGVSEASFTFHLLGTIIK